MNKTIWCVRVALVSALLLALPVTLADNHEEASGPQYVIAHYEHVDPTKTAEYEATARAWVAAFSEKNMGSEWAWQGFSNGDFTYAYVSSIPNFAYLDSRDEREAQMAETLGEEKMAELMQFMQYVTSHRTEVLKIREDLGYSPKESAVSGGSLAPFAHVDVHHVKPGMTEQFTDMVGDVAAAFDKAGGKMGWSGYEIVFGEGSFVFVSRADDAAQFYSQPDTAEVLAEGSSPEEAMAMFQAWTGSITTHETTDWQFRRELSYMPGMPMGDEEGGADE